MASVAYRVLQESPDAAELVLSFLTFYEVNRVACVCRLWFCASKQWMRHVQSTESWGVRWKYDDVRELFDEMLGMLSLRSELYLSDSERAILVRALDAALCAIPESRVRLWKLVNYRPAGVERRCSAAFTRIFLTTLHIPPGYELPALRSHQYLRHPGDSNLFLIPKGDAEVRCRVKICLSLIADGVFRWMLYPFRFPSLIYNHGRTLSAIHAMTRLPRLLGCTRVTTIYVTQMLHFFTHSDHVLHNPHVVVAMICFFRSVGRRIIGATFASRLVDLICSIAKRFIAYPIWNRFDQCELLASLLRLLSEQRKEYLHDGMILKLKRALRRYVRDESSDLHRSTKMLFSILNRIVTNV